MVTEAIVLKYMGMSAFKMLFKVILESKGLGFLSDMADDFADKLPENLKWMKDSIKNSESEHVKEILEIEEQVIESEKLSGRLSESVECKKAFDDVFKFGEFEFKAEYITGETLAEEMIKAYNSNNSGYDGKYDELFKAFADKYIEKFWEKPHDSAETNEILKSISDSLNEQGISIEELNARLTELDGRVDKVEKDIESSKK